MAQQIRVLQCLECSLYQVDIVKKSNRWECKVCRHKQNVQKEFFRGTGAECRAKVQHLNLVQAQKVQSQDEHNLLAVQQNQDSDITSCELEIPTGMPQSKRTKLSSKWADYMEVPIPTAPPRTRAHRPQDDLDEPKNTSSTTYPSGSNNRSTHDDFVVNKKPFSKWQNFIE